MINFKGNGHFLELSRRIYPDLDQSNYFVLIFTEKPQFFSDFEKLLENFGKIRIFFRKKNHGPETSNFENFQKRLEKSSIKGC